MPLRLPTCCTVVAASMLALGACATPHSSGQPLEAAANSIRDAERSGGGIYATVDMANARDHFAIASAAEHDREYDTARQYAEVARADADLAGARTQSAKAQLAHARIMNGIEELRCGETP